MTARPPSSFRPNYHELLSAGDIEPDAAQANADDTRIRLHRGPGRTGAALAGAGTDLACARLRPA